ncbi:MAG: HEAT repeat domain-containing protein [Bradymonadaceae bacterium]|nr:HEAT repeat domain-containing protein [Lujinxingiaceae bacterium]
MDRGQKKAWRSKSAVLLAGAAALTMTFGAGCEQPNWEDPAYVSKKLSEGDATTRRMALEHARKLPDEKKAEIVPALSALYLDGTVGQKESMALLVQIRHPAGGEAYLAEVKTNAAGYAGAAAEAIGQANIKSAIPGMLELLNKTDSSEVKQGILRGLSHMPDPQYVGPLVEILKLDVDNNPIGLHAYACEILGSIGQKTPSAIDDEARRTLVRAVFLANNRGQNVGRECGLAVQLVGASAVPVLLETFKGENSEIQQLLMTYNRPPEFTFPANHAKLVATIRLTGMRSKEAVAPFIADLSSTKAAPVELGKTDHAVAWRMKEGNITDEIIMGLGDIGDPAARPVLEQVLLGERNEAWDDITDGLVELQLRQDAANALNKLGDRAALPSLLKMAREGVIIDLERRFAMLEKGGRPGSLLERYQFNWMAAQAYAMLASGEHLAEYQKFVDATKEADLKTKYESYLPLFAVASECGGKADDSARAACYGEKLTVKEDMVREKAAFELSRLPAAIAGPILVSNLDTNNLGTRESITFALYRAPSQAAIDKVDEILEKEANRSGQEYRLDHYRLRLLRGWMTGNVAPAATSER